jgi:3-methyl-2-oxobutanoate hydroxymethyltransferase
MRLIFSIFLSLFIFANGVIILFFDKIERNIKLKGLDLKKKLTLNDILRMKSKEKIVVITAYDALFASLIEESADIILVGDSLNMSFAGEEDTLSATLNQMIYHTKAVCKGAPDALIVTDMPFGTYNNEDEALRNATKVYQQTKAAAIKIEGGQERAHIIEHLTKNSIAVVGHIGLMPQFVRSEGGYKVRGKTQEDIEQLIADAIAIEKAGAFCIVIEGVVSEAAKAISEAVTIPTIGIGAGGATDGQVLVWSDMLGFFTTFVPKFVKQYMQGAEDVKMALAQFSTEVKNGKFPEEKHTY